jgi:RsiW-degrading membrane proteinase PrsW (M82 family)
MARQMLLRTTALPLVHATFTGVNGYFIASRRRIVANRVALCAAGLGVAAILHGVYDFGSEVWRFFLAAAAHLVLISRARQ